MKKIIVIFDSKEQNELDVSYPATVPFGVDYDIELWDMSSKVFKVKRKANSLFYQCGATKSPLYLFEENGDIYDSHYFEHGPLTKEVTMKKLTNG